MSVYPIRYTDDPDAHVTYPITSEAGQTLDFAAQVAVGSAGFTVAATWEGDPDTTRNLRVPLSGVEVGMHHLYLQVPGDNDVPLGIVSVRSRS